LDETAFLVCTMAYKVFGGLKGGKMPYYSNRNEQELTNSSLDEEKDNKATNIDVSISQEKEYCSVVKKVKKENITADNIGEIMLCQIPGVSSASALAILSQFKTLPNLIKSIQEDTNCLANVSTTDSNGKSRKISKTAIATIVKYLEK
jgi:hypothetical protein